METTEQRELWNGDGGQAWVALQPLLDDVLGPFERLLVEEVRSADPRPPLLDVGCGAGATTLALAREVGECEGVDVSEPLVTAAIRRASEAGLDVRFICADAQRHRFEPSRYGAVVSRFGVMFFDDPDAAFANLRSAARDGAILRLVAWRSPAENPFTTAAERAAAPLLPLPPRDLSAPGQFAFADGSRVRSILEGAGWRDVELEPIEVACSLPASELVRYVTNLGPLARALAGADEATRQAVLDVVLPAFEPFVHDGVARIDAACWLIRGRA